MKVSDILTEAPLPQDWDPAEFRQQGTTFKSRLAYALERAKRIGAGSSRVAMNIEYQGRPTVLKIAKNNKGLAQNAEEVAILNDGFLGQLDIVIPLIDYDQEHAQPLWMQTELATRASEKQLCAIMKTPYLSVLWQVADAVQKGARPEEYWSYQKATERMQREGYSAQDIDIFTHYVNQLADLLHHSNVLPGDFSRAANWGLYQGRPVIIDLGYTENSVRLYRRN